MFAHFKVPDHEGSQLAVSGDSGMNASDEKEDTHVHAGSILHEFKTSLDRVYRLHTPPALIMRTLNWTLVIWAQ